MSRFKRLFTSFGRTSKLGLALVCLFIVGFAQPVAADTIGVGVGTGRIRPDEALLPGLSYDLPSIAVFNTGDVGSDYEMSVQYNEKQDELKPAAPWVTFTPQTFYLEPGNSQEVKITLHPQSSARPGQYFAYLEAQPIKKDSSGGVTAIKIAAATKLNFEVAPANRWQRIYYALLNFWRQHTLLLIIILGFVAAALVVLFVKKFMRIEFRKHKYRRRY